LQIFTVIQTKTLLYTGLLKIIVWVLTTCYTQYAWDRSM